MSQRGFAKTRSAAHHLPLQGASMDVLAGGHEVGDACSVVIWRREAGRNRWHVHDLADEAFYVLEGDFTIECGVDVFHVTAGMFAFFPRGVPHRTTVGPGGGTTLVLAVPGGMDRYFAALSEALSAGTLDPALEARLAAEHGIRNLDQ